MIRIFIDQDYLKAYVPNLDNLLFTGEEDFSKEKRAAEQEVLQDFLNSRHRAVAIRNDLDLRSSGTTLTDDASTDSSAEDTISRTRWVVNVTTYTASASLELQGRDASDDDWNTVSSMTITETGENSEVITKYYKYYRVVAMVTGSLDYESFLTESVYDLLHAYKWAMIINRNRTKQEGDQYYVKYELCKAYYDKLFNDMVLYLDTDNDGEVDTGISNNSIKMYK